MIARRKDPAGESASEQIRLRLSPRRKRLLEYAAQLRGVPVAELALGAALEHAALVVGEDPAIYVPRGWRSAR